MASLLKEKSSKEKIRILTEFVKNSDQISKLQVHFKNVLSNLKIQIPVLNNLDDLENLYEKHFSSFVGYILMNSYFFTILL